jgi:hypothetical protein
VPELIVFPEFCPNTRIFKVKTILSTIQAKEFHTGVPLGDFMKNDD